MSPAQSLISPPLLFIMASVAIVTDLLPSLVFPFFHLPRHSGFRQNSLTSLPPLVDHVPTSLILVFCTRAPHDLVLTSLITTPAETLCFLLLSAEAPLFSPPSGTKASTPNGTLFSLSPNTLRRVTSSNRDNTLSLRHPCSFCSFTFVGCSFTLRSLGPVLIYPGHTLSKLTFPRLSASSFILDGSSFVLFFRPSTGSRTTLLNLLFFSFFFLDIFLAFLSISNECPVSGRAAARSYKSLYRVVCPPSLLL